MASTVQNGSGISQHGYCACQPIEHNGHDYQSSLTLQNQNDQASFISCLPDPSVNGAAWLCSTHDGAGKQRRSIHGWIRQAKKKDMEVHSKMGDDSF
jgi:hypothetical protein